jgi:hypothetical protein
MKKAEVIEFFNGRINAATALGITPQAISLWGDEVPARSLARIETVMEQERERRIKENDPVGDKKYPALRRYRRKVMLREVK